MSYKSHNDLRGLSQCYCADLFKILHCEQLTGKPLPCQLLQPIKLNQWSGKKNQVRGMENPMIFPTSLPNFPQIWRGFSRFTQSFLLLWKWAVSFPSTLVLHIILPLCAHFWVSLTEWVPSWGIELRHLYLSCSFATVWIFGGRFGRDRDK